jgi:putative Holliday junction resolvase
MKYLGIDFGLKRIGLSVSDDNGMIAFPGETIAYNPQTIGELEKLIEYEQVGEIVIGDTLSGDGEKNKVTETLETFIQDLTLATGLPIHLEREFFTTQFARQYDKYEKPVANPHRSGIQIEKNDSSAAAIILQRYLDKKQHGK